MTKEQKIEKLFNPKAKDILLSDFLAPKQVRTELAEFLKVSTEKEMLDLLGVDFYYLPCRDISQNESCFEYYHGTSLQLNESVRTCPFGIRWHRKVGVDKFGVDEAISGPFSDIDVKIEKILDYNWPSPYSFDFSSLADECDKYSDKIIIGGLWSAIQGDSSRMMGFENFLLNIALNKPLVKVLVDRVTEFYLEANRLYFEAVKGKMDIFFMGNDFGSQNGLLISEEDWIDIYYENYKKLINLAHGYGFKVMVHSCGSILALIPYLIEIGVDIIDPVQITSKDMNPETLNSKFGADIVFHGAIDTQNIIPFGTDEEVEDHCLYLIRNLNKYGNYIVAPSNNFMHGTPCKNIVAVYNTVKRYKSDFIRIS
ncbi:MAG: uroporphyrinogen decarboxylase family protein [Bacteroidota bacterium]